jgi:hypothetical protein
LEDECKAHEKALGVESERHGELDREVKRLEEVV